MYHHLGFQIWNEIVQFFAKKAKDAPILEEKSHFLVNTGDDILDTGKINCN